jgi:hypothetical protein
MWPIFLKIILIISDLLVKVVENGNVVQRDAVQGELLALKNTLKHPTLDVNNVQSPLNPNFNKNSANLYGGMSSELSSRAEILPLNTQAIPFGVNSIPLQNSDGTSVNLQRNADGTIVYPLRSAGGVLITLQRYPDGTFVLPLRNIDGTLYV